MSQQEPSKRDRRRQDVAARIEIATRELCLAHGIDGVSVDAVAAQVGISRRTIYRYYPSIEDILLASSRRSLARISHDVRAQPPGATVREAFARAFSAKTITDQEALIQRLDRLLAERQRAAWLRLSARIEADTLDVFTGAVAERMPAAADGMVAPMVAKVLLTIITHLFPFGAGDGAGSHEDVIAALDAVIAVLRARGVDRPDRY